MEKRRLGNSDLYVNPVGLGCMGFSHASGDPVPEEIYGPDLLGNCPRIQTAERLRLVKEYG
jgi:aryl-alcohol dehydrogenase-like predicted oxidoreductase